MAQLWNENFGKKLAIYICSSCACEAYMHHRNQHYSQIQNPKCFSTLIWKFLLLLKFSFGRIRFSSNFKDWVKKYYTEFCLAVLVGSLNHLNYQGDRAKLSWYSRLYGQFRAIFCHKDVEKSLTASHVLSKLLCLFKVQLW